MAQELAIPVEEAPATKTPAQQTTPSRPRMQQPWRLPNGFEEYYMLLALHTKDRQWCDRMSIGAQIRKVDARAGVQVIPWRAICLIEVAALTKNKGVCKFVQGVTVDNLNGKEFNAQYCEATVAARALPVPDFAENHWLETNPFSPKLINAQGILRSLGFSEKDLLSQEQQGLYQVVTRKSWDDFLIKVMLDSRWVTNPNRPDPDKFNIMVKRSVNLPNFANGDAAADRFLQYTGTNVKLPANCYENPTSEFSCRMLQCLASTDLLTCRALAKSADTKALRDVYYGKCEAANKQLSRENIESVCKREVDDPYTKVFLGPPETFLPYLVR